MQRLPVCNTRHDYEYIRNNAVPGWEAVYRALLEGRFVVHDGELVEDATAPIFKHGFTVGEIAEAIDFTGTTSREIEWMESQPDRYRFHAGEWSEIEGWQAIRDKAVFDTAKADLIAANRSACSAHILSKYPLAIQSSASLGVYPQAIKDAMTDFIGRCIAIENATYDIIEAATTMAQLEAIPSPVYSEV